MKIILDIEEVNLGRGVKVEYSLFSSNESYGIKSKLSTDKRNGEYETEVEDITTIKEYAKEIFDEIVKNKVSPCHLGDVIIDKICN